MSKHYFAILALGLASCAQPQVGSDMKAADIVLQHGGSAPALAVAQTELSINPDNVLALNVQGDSEYLEGRIVQAKASFNKALQLDSRNDRAMVGLGRIALRTDPVEAESWFRRAVKVAPQNADAKVDLGVALDRQGRFNDAQKCYNEVIATFPENERAIVNLGISTALSGNNQQALQILAPVAYAEGSSRLTRLNAAFVMILANEPSEAEKLLSKFLGPADVQKIVQKFSLSAQNLRNGQLKATSSR